MVAPYQNDWWVLPGTILAVVFITWFLLVTAAGDFGTEGEAGVDDTHLDRPRYVRLADNGSLLISDQHRVLEVDAAGHVVQQLRGTFCDVTWLDDTGWAALNGTSTSACDRILFSNGTTVQLPHQAQRLHPDGEDLVVGGMHQNITKVDRTGTSLETCEFVTGYISDLDLDHYLYDGGLYSYNLSTCSSNLVASPPGDTIYSFQAMPNMTFSYGVGWSNGSRAVVWGNWTSWITSFPEDLDWNGTHLAAVDFNAHLVRVWQMEEAPPPPDRDGDGIPDHLDPCPDDKENLCVDVDGDGYNASVDACPSTWGNSTVDRFGCPDTDGDGVSDLNDPCPEDPLDLCGDEDGDGVSDGDDDCPTVWGNSSVDRLGCPDRDGDGWSDDGDLFPDDPAEWADGDGDGVGDNGDSCPTTWGNSTAPPGCPDRDGDGLADIADPCPDDPDNRCDDPPPELEFHDVVGIPSNTSYLLEFTVHSSDCHVEEGGFSTVYSDELGPGTWFYQHNFTDLVANTTYTFRLRCVDGAAEGWLNHTGTTLADTGGDGGGDGEDGEDGNVTPTDGTDGDGGGPGLLEITPGGLPVTYVLISLVLVAGLSAAIIAGGRPERDILPPRVPAPLPEAPWTDLDELEDPLEEVGDHTEPLASPELFVDLPRLPAPDRMWLPEAPSPVPRDVPYLAIQVAEAEDLPMILERLRGRVKPEISPENQKVLKDVQDLEKRLRQLRDDRDIAPRKYEKLLQEVQDLKRAVQNLTPLMERRDWDV